MRDATQTARRSFKPVGAEGHSFAARLFAVERQRNVKQENASGTPLAPTQGQRGNAHRRAWRSELYLRVWRSVASSAVIGVLFGLLIGNTLFNRPGENVLLALLVMLASIALFTALVRQAVLRRAPARAYSRPSRAARRRDGATR